MDEHTLICLAIERVLSFVANRWIERQIQGLLRQAGGDVDKALALLASSGLGPSMGWFGASGPGELSLEARGSAARNSVISVWSPSTQRFTEPPDVTFTWREVFTYVQNGGRLPHQLSLF